MNITKSLELIDQLFEETPNEVLMEMITAINANVKHDVSFEEYLDVLTNQLTDLLPTMTDISLECKNEPISVKTPCHVSIGAAAHYYTNSETPLAA